MLKTTPEACPKSSPKTKRAKLLGPEDFLERADEEVDRAARYDRPLCVAMLQINDLPMLRKAHGGTATDAAFTQTTELVLGATRGPDRIGRLGTAQLGILLPEATVTSGTKVLERIRDSMANTDFEIAGSARKLAVSIGLAGLSPRHRSSGRFLMAACFELRRAQANGVNQVCAAAPDRVRMSLPRSAELH